MDIISSGAVYISSGTSTDICVVQEGELHILNGGTAQIVALSEGGKTVVSRGGLLNKCIVSGGGTATVLSSGYAEDVTVGNSGLYLVSSGGTAHKSIIESGGTQIVFKETTVSSAVVLDGGMLHVSADGTVRTLVVSHGGTMILWQSVARLAEIRGTAEISAGAALNSAVGLDGGRITVHANGHASKVEINSGCELVASGGSVNSVTVNSGGSVNIAGEGSCFKAFISSGGRLVVSGDGIVNSAAVSVGGLLCISGGTAANIREYGGYVDAASDADAAFASNTISGLVLSDTAATIHSGTTANDTVIRSGSLYVFSSGVANDTIVELGGRLTVSADGIATNIKENGGWVEILDDAAASFAENVISGLALSGTDATVHSGTTAEKTTIENGRMFVYSGGIAKDTTAAEGTDLRIYNGGRLTGKMTFEGGAAVSAYDGAIVEFDLTRTSAGAAALMNDLSAIQGMPLYTLSVNGLQASGDYTLAEGASGFGGVISVRSTTGAELGALSVGQTLETRYADYSLALDGGMLSVSLVSHFVPGMEPLFFAGYFGGEKQAMLAKENNSHVTVYNDGTAWGGLVLDSGWHIVGAGDFDGDGLDDLLRMNAEGYVAGEMSDGTGAFNAKPLNFKQSGWDIVGAGDFDGDGADDVLIANPTAASETVGLLGYWKGGEEWTLINGYSAEWEMVATGDFNGDGKCDMLWRNWFTGDDELLHNAYCTWIVDPPAGDPDWRMVSVADPLGWTFLCAGDFNGDGSHDIAMINDEGVVGIWGLTDGCLSSWSILSAVNPAEWSLAGVGDFDGDGTDDIAWQNNETRLAGFWQIKNYELASWKTSGILA